MECRVIKRVALNRVDGISIVVEEIAFGIAVAVQNDRQAERFRSKKGPKIISTNVLPEFSPRLLGVVGELLGGKDRSTSEKNRNGVEWSSETNELSLIRNSSTRCKLIPMGRRNVDFHLSSAVIGDRGDHHVGSDEELKIQIESGLIRWIFVKQRPNHGRPGGVSFVEQGVIVRQESVTNAKGTDHAGQGGRRPRRRILIGRLPNVVLKSIKENRVFPSTSPKTTILTFRENG